MKDSATASVTYAWDRPWFEYWQYVLWRIEFLAAYLTGSGTGQRPTAVAKFFVTDCCLALSNLLDWIEKAEGLTAQERQCVLAKLRGDNLVAEIQDVADTLKHYGRNPGRCFARVSQVGSDANNFGSGRIVTEITFIDGSGATHTRDGLELVTRTRDLVHQTLKDCGVADPYAEGSGLPLS